MASSCVPLALHAMPATCVSGERLNSRTLELLLLCTYDACAHADQGSQTRLLWRVCWD